MKIKLIKVREGLHRGLLCMVAIVCFSCVGGGSSTASSESKVVTVAAPSDFNITDQTAVELGVKQLGRLNEGEVIEGVITLTNSLDEPLVILSARGSCGCVSLSYDKAPIKTHGARSISYTYNSKGKKGKQIAIITIETNKDKYKVNLEVEIINQAQN